MFCNDSSFDCYERKWKLRYGGKKNIVYKSGIDDYKESMEESESEYSFHLHRGEERFIEYESTDKDFVCKPVEGRRFYTITRTYHALTPLLVSPSTTDHHIFEGLQHKFE